MDIYFKLDTYNNNFSSAWIEQENSFAKNNQYTMVNVHAHLKEIDDHYSSYIIIDVFCFVTNK